MIKKEISVGDRWLCRLGNDEEIEYLFTVIAKIKIGKKIYFSAIKTKVNVKHSWPIIFDEYGRQVNDDFGFESFKMLAKAIFYKNWVKIIR